MNCFKFWTGWVDMERPYIILCDVFLFFLIRVDMSSPVFAHWMQQFIWLKKFCKIPGMYWEGAQLQSFHEWLLFKMLLLMYYLYITLYSSVSKRKCSSCIAPNTETWQMKRLIWLSHLLSAICVLLYINIHLKHFHNSESCHWK